ncbi:MAG: OmpH family outer membrane protein [Sphingobacteriales bacterium]|nr:MAG: OmpH family outer membrane protein [Sphingobacteriales bacterium]
MKNLSLALSAIALVGVIVLFGMQMSGNKGMSSGKSSVTPPSGSVKIAYVNIDTLEANYTYLKTKRDEFMERQQSMNAELERSFRQYEADRDNFQRKYQAGTVTQAEAEATAKRLGQMEQSLYARKESMAQTLIKEQDEFNKNLQKELEAYLEEYNKDKSYDYILSYSQSGSILYKNAALNITKDVIDGMNSRTPTQVADTTKKKK